MAKQIIGDHLHYWGEHANSNGEVVLRQYIHKSNRFRFNWHPYIEINVVVKGQIEAYVAGEVFQMFEDDVLLINSNVGHATLERQPNTKVMVIHISSALFSPLKTERIGFACCSTSETRNNSAFRELRSYAARLMNEVGQDEQSAHLFTQGLIHMLAAHLLREFASSPSGEEGIDVNNSAAPMVSHKTIQTIIDYTETHYYERISLDVIARLTQYHKSYISTFFKYQTGINYYEYLQRVRLRHGVHALNKSPKSVTDIALETGFSDAKSFTTMFKKYFIITPAQYRETIKFEQSPIIDALDRVFVERRDEDVENKLRQYHQLQTLETAHPPALSSPKQQQIKQVKVLLSQLEKAIDHL